MSCRWRGIVLHRYVDHIWTLRRERTCQCRLEIRRGFQTLTLASVGTGDVGIVRALRTPARAVRGKHRAVVQAERRLL